MYLVRLCLTILFRLYWKCLGYFRMSENMMTTFNPFERETKFFQ